MSWRPERGWRSLIVRAGASLAAAVLLWSSVMEARGVRIAEDDDDQAKVVPHEHAPATREHVTGIIERARIIDGSPARRSFPRPADGGESR